MCYHGPKRRGRKIAFNDALHEYWRQQAQKKRAKKKAMETNRALPSPTTKKDGSENKRIP